MDRRAAGALLALAACIACSAAAPTASNHTALDLYEGASEGCYYNFQHYGEGDRIMTNEPCLNCTCHNRMLMCYLRVCPFTKPIGQDCTVEKRADQCCPIVTCPDVPVDLLTSTSTSSPAEYGATGLGKLDKYGCSISGKYFPEGSKVPPTPNKPCEHCYCIRNMTTCVMQECTLHVDGCTPIYHKDVCCPVRYSCDHPEDEMPLLDDMSTTVRPTPGFLLTTTTVSPVTQMTQDCVHNDQIIADGASITTEKACEHCYCMKGDIVCVVQECGAPMENEGKNCTSLPPREGQCCPDTYICEGDEPSTEVSTESATELILEKLTTLLPPRRGGVEGSGYRNEPNEAYTEVPTAESEIEGSGEEQEPNRFTAEHEAITEKPQEITPILEEDDQYIPVTTKAPTSEEAEATTKEIERNVIEDGDLVKVTAEPEIYHSTTHIPVEKDEDEMASGVTESEELSQEHVTTTGTLVSEKYDQYTTEPGESLNTVPDTVAEKEHDKPHEFTHSTTGTPIIDENEPAKENEPKTTTSTDVQGVTLTPISEHTSKTEYSTSPENVHEIEIGTTDKSQEMTEEIVDKESGFSGTTSVPTVDDIRTISPATLEHVSAVDKSEETDITKPEQNIQSTTSMPLEDIEKLTTEPNHAQNTIDIAEDEGYPHVPGLIDSEKTTVSNLGEMVTEKVVKEDDIQEHISDEIPVTESKTTVEPDKGLNTIPSETDEESSSQPSLVDKTTASFEVQSTELPIVDAVEPQESDIKTPTASEPSSTLVDIHVTKVDQYTITTEPSFRKEDEISVSTEKPKEEPAATTIKAEFVDEGLIPTSSHDEKLGTGSDISTIDEDVTTMLPEYNKEIDETKQPTTQSIPETSIDTGSLPEMAVETTREPEAALVPSTEKDAEVTAIPDVDSHQEPSRIPGEGDCLLNSVTYKNNTVVPSTNNCHTGCKCISSIIKCDPIICSPPPDYMDNCQSIYDTPDSCCPTYVCDHPRETIPPQSDNQMSGTEPPVPPPTIECRGDQCELSEPTKPTGSSELCATGSCLPAADDKTTTQCGPEGCDGLVKEPESLQPSIEHPECTDGKCEISAEGCANGKCELPSVVSPSVKPCAGDDCEVTDEKMPASQLCENGNDCKTPVTQTIPSHGSHKAPCKEEDGCQLEEVIPSVCTGEEPCRRVETPVIEQSPSKCQGSDCVQETNIAVTEDIQQVNTESSVPQETSSEPGKEHTVVEEERPGQEIVTEREYTPAEHYTTVVTEKAPEVQDIATEEPVTEEKVVTKSPGAIEVYTNEPTTEISNEASSSKIPDASQDEQGIKMPEAIEKEHFTPDDNDKENTDKPSSVDIAVEVTEEYVSKTTEMPDAVEKYTDEPTYEPGTRIPDVTEDYIEKSTKMPDIDTSALDTELDKKDPDAVEVYTNKPTVSEEDESKKPNVEGMDYTEKAPSVEEQESKTTISIDDVHTDKPITIQDDSIKTSDVTEEYTEKLTEKPDAVEEHTDESSSVVESETKVPGFLEEEHTTDAFEKEEDTRAPDTLSEEHTDKPQFVEKQETKIPDAVEETTDKIAPVEGEGTKIPELTDKYGDKPTEVSVAIDEHSDEPMTVDESGTKTPDKEINQTEEPVTVYEEGQSTKIPDHGDEHSEKQPSIKEPETEIPDIGNKEPIDEISSTEKEGINIPQATEKYEPTKISEEDTKTTITSEEQTMEIPDEVTDKTDEPKPSVSDDTTEPSAEQEESTEIIEPIKESSTKKPIIIDDDIEGSTDEQPVGSEEPSKKPVVVEIDQTYTSVNEEQTSKPENQEPTLIHQDEESSGTKAPEILVTASEILSEEHTKPYVEIVTPPQTSVSEGDLTTEPNVVDVGIPEVTSVPVTMTSEPSDVKETQSQDIDKNIPTENVPEILTEQEKTTNEPLDEKISQDTSIHVPDNEATKSPFEPSTPPQELSTSEHKATTIPEFMVTTESVERITLLKDQDTITEQGELYTDIPERETLATESPGEEISKPQEDTQPKLPDSTEQSTKVPEKEIIQPDLESHIADTGSGYESTSALPEPEIVKVTENPEIFDDETRKTTISETQQSESEKTPTLTHFGTSEQDTKTDGSDIFTPEKEQMITTTKDTVVTESTISSFTEIKDASITGDEDASTGYYGETTEKLEPTITIDASSVASPSTSETPLLDAKTTRGPEESYTNAHEITDTPTVAETKPADSDVSDKSETSPTLAVQESTTSQSPELSKVTSESGISEEPHRRTETTESNEIGPETTERPIPELPVSIVTESEAKPIEIVPVPEEKTTETVDLINLDASTLPPEISVTNAPVATEIPEAHITTSSKPEESKGTESSYTQPDITEPQEASTKSEESDTSIEKTTRSPEIPVKTEGTESDIETALPGVQQSSTDYPATVVEIRTELPQIPVTTETPQSLVTEYHQPDIEVPTKEQDYKEPLLHETEPKPEEETTEKTDVTASVVEVTTSKQLEEITKPAEFSETTPYPIVELEEHTHKTQEDISTISPVNEKEPTHESGEVTSTQLPPSKEEHTTAQHVTADEEHIDLSTVSPSIEEYTQKIPEETPAVSLPTDELTTAQPETGIQDTKAPTEMKPQEDIETTAKPIEIPSGLYEESSTIMGVVSDQTTLSGPEEASESVPESYTSTKPAHEESTGVPTVVQDDEQMEVTTSKPTHDLGEIPAAIPTESSTLGFDIETPTEKDISATEKPSHPPIHEASDKTPVPEDEIIYSTIKPTTAIQEDLLTPSSEDKYTKPEDKPTSEVIPPSSTAEVPKPSAEIEPTEEIPAPDDDGHFPPSATGYGETDYGEEDQAFGPGTCRYGGKVYVSAQQIPRDDPCDFCFCFRSDIICLQQSCPPPIHGCHEEPIQGFCCPRYECPVSMATTVNVTTTTTTTTTTVPPNFPTHSYKGAAQRRGCQIKGHTYKVGEVVRSASGPCLHCKCGGDGQMKCDPKACTPEPMLRQMIAAAVSAKRRR